MSLVDLILERHSQVYSESEKQLQRNSIIALICIATIYYTTQFHYILYLGGVVLFNMAGLTIKFFRPKTIVPLERKIIETPKKKPIQPPVTTPIAFQSPKSPLKTHILKRKEFSPIGSKLSYSPSKEIEASPSSDTFGHFQLPSRFQNALKPTQSPQRKEILEDGLVLKDHEQTLKLWHVEKYIDQWSEQMRKWLSLKVLEPLVKRIDAMDQELTKLGWDHLRCEVATYQESLNTQPVQPMFAGTFQTKQKPNTLMELQNLYAKEPIAKERLAIERYLMMDFNCRGYIVQRIRQLAGGSCLSQYRWNSGAKYLNQPWDSQKYPSDGILIMTLFCKFMDEKCPGELFDPHQPFTHKYFCDSLKSQFHSGVRIRQQSKFPPHYQILIDSTCYDVFPGRNNVFDSLSLFVNQIKVNYSGYLGLLFLGGKSIDLLSVVSSNSFQH